MKTRTSTFIFLLMITSLFRLQGQDGPETGFFSGYNNVGDPVLKGDAAYRASDQSYLISGAGTNIWFAEDQFSYLWKKMDGNFIIQAEVAFLGDGVDPHRKAGLMIRTGLETDAAHVACTVHGDGLTALQYRKSRGADMEEIQFEIKGPAVLQLEKHGNTFTMSVAHRGDLYAVKSLDLALESDASGKFHTGLFVCSHNPEVVEEARFHNVRVFGTQPDDFVQYQQYLGSLLEVMDVESGHRMVLDAYEASWQAPNWTPDGKTLIYNSDGLLFNYDLASGNHCVLNTGKVTRNNNDHVLSFGGEYLAISSAAEETGQSAVFVVPTKGGEPRRITELTPSYLHGWSGDNKHLVYVGARNGAYDIYKISVDGGEEVRLTNEPTLDDGPEYSPDGKFIYFNSARTGTMQIWRMKPDGSAQEQLTFDEQNDWFPHISPDGKWVAFISFPPDVPAGDHPFYKRVTLRLMSVEDWKPRVIGYLYGGQGSMNVPSWSPDSRKIAFVSNGIFD